MTALKREILVDKRIIIFMVFLAALGIRLIALKQNYVIAKDGAFYITLAQQYYAGNLSNYYYAFLPILILFLNKILDNWILAGQLISILCGALTVIPLYLLGRQIFDEKIALLGATFYIVCPNLVQYSAEVLRDIPFVFFYTMSLWCAYSGIKAERVSHLVLAGIFVILCVFLRIEGLTLLISISIFFFWYWIKNDIPWKKRLITFGAFWASALCIFFVLGFSFSQKGIKISTEQISRTTIAFTILENQTIKKLEKEVEEKGISQKGRELFHIASKHRFVLYSSHILYKTVKVFNILFLLFLFGLVKRKEMRYRQDEFLLFAIYAALVPAFLLYLNVSNHLSIRHPFPLVVPSLIWSGVGFVEFKERVALWIKEKDFPLREWAARWITPLLLLIICIPLLLMAWAPNRRDKLELKEIGLWLKHNGHAQSIITGQLDFSRLAFYAEGDFIPLPRGSYEDIVRFAKEKKANLLVINGKTIDRFSPNFLNLVSDRDLQRIYIPGIKTPKYATLVFQVKDLKGKALHPR